MSDPTQSDGYREFLSKLTRWNHREKRKRPRERRRRLRSEKLESRNLLAGDFFHNRLIPEDVNNDGEVTAHDALVVLNEMSRDQIRDDAFFTDVNNDGRRSAVDALMVLNRLGRGEDGRIRPPVDDDDQRPPNPPTDPSDKSTDEVRSIDGTGNNLESEELGSTNTPLLRVADADYADGVSSPAGEGRPSAREISNLLSVADPDGTTSSHDLSAFVFMWGQFLDHDIDLSPEQSGDDAESFDIEVPLGDPLFDPFATGNQTIHLTRSAIDPSTGTSIDNPAQQINAITAWIDGSQVYGSDLETANALREFVGGRLLMTEDGLLPTDQSGHVIAGDVRAAENIALTSMHALFVREHNRIAEEIAAGDPDLSDEEIYQRARNVVIAELQAITFNEFLPALLGEDAIAAYAGYDPTVDPTIANEFSTAAFRFGHSTLNDEIPFIGDDGLAWQEPITLAEAFFNPSMLETTGIDWILKGGASVLSQQTDLQVVDSLRNLLFGQPGSGGLDLVSLNIQRGRDHGLADFNSTRVAYGLDAYESFDQITSDPELQDNLESLYGDVNDIDLWVGLMAEDHASASALGELSTLIIADQFQRLRDGDRFWYENTLARNELREINNTSLADIIERNTDVTSLQENVFVFSPQLSGVVSSVTQSTDSITSLDDEIASTLETMHREGDSHHDGHQDRRNPSKPGHPDLDPVEGMLIELLDADGNVVDTAVTDANGVYRFHSFDSTGAYQVRMSVDDTVEIMTESTLDVLISAGDERLRGYNFTILA